MAPIAELAQLPSFERLGYHESPPPFVNGLLQERNIFVVSQNDFRSLIERADARTPKLLADQMTREVDITGFVPEFIGRCTTPEEVQAELDNIALHVLLKLQQEPQELQDKVHNLLIAKPDDASIDHEGFYWLDQQHGAIMDELAKQRTPEAEKFRERTNEAIKQAKNTDVIYTPTYSTSPTYAKYFDGESCHVVHIQRLVHIPTLPEENRKILEQLTPKVFKRQGNIPDQLPSTVIGFMQQFRKAGDPLSRALAEKMEEKNIIQKFAKQHIDFSR